MGSSSIHHSNIVKLEIDFKSIAEAFPIAMVLINKEEEIIYANPTAEVLFNKKVSTSHAYRCGDFISCVNSNIEPMGCGYSDSCSTCSLLAAIRSTLHSGDDASAWGETEIFRHDHGSHIHLKYNVKKIEISGEIFLALVLNDISESKHMESRLEGQFDFNKKILDSMPARTAIFGEDGIISAVNLAWREYAKKNNGGDESKWGVGASYFRPCIVNDPDFISAQNAYEGLRDVQTGKRSSFQMEYSCNNPSDGETWFSMQALPLMGFPGQVLVSHVDITERKKAELALEESENRFRMIANNTSDGIIVIQNDTITFASPAYCHILGYSESEEIGRTREEILALIHPDDVAHVLETIMTAISMGNPSAIYSYRAKAKNGEYVWREDHARFLYNAKGEYEKALVVCRDVTARKRVEEALQTSEEHNRAMLAALPDMLFRIDEQFRFVSSHAPDPSLLLTPKESFLGKTAREVLPPDLAEQTERLVQITLSDGVPRFYEYTLDLPIGKRFFEARMVMCGRGEVLSIVRDISERKAAEVALRESEEKYRSMMESMSDLVCICSPDRRVEYMNNAMIQKIGRDATGEPCFQALCHSSEIYPECTFEKVRQGSVVESDMINPIDGHPYHVTSAPIVHVDGSISQMSIFKDMTEIKKLEKRLQQSQKMEAIGTLAGGIAHDFNNILFPIIGISEMLLQDLSVDGPHYEVVTLIHRSALRAADLVKQILSFSRQGEHEINPITIQPILKEVVKLIRAGIPSYIDIVQDIGNECGRVSISPTNLHQIVMNLLTNAYHAVESSGGIISIELKEVVSQGENVPGFSLKAGKYALITISDTGCGIEPEVMGKIFDPYFTTKPHGKGTGLGLSVVYGIVNDHGGSIRVSSELAKGSSFEVYLPIADNPDVLDADESSLPYEKGKEHILVVDDEEMIVVLEQMMLERLGYQVTPRVGSIAALGEFRSHPERFDLVIMDMTMPNMTGDQLAAELIKIRPDIPIIICTGFSEKINETRPIDIGVKSFITKPISMKELAATVKRALDTNKR